MSVITFEDQQWLLGNQPGMFTLQTAHSAIVQGAMRFKGVYSDVVDDRQEIKDEYKLKLELFEDKPPVVHEVGGRIDSKLLDKPELNRADLHVYKDGKLCLAAPQQLTLDYMPNRSVEKFFQDYVIPYFYSQSYHERFSEWPWRHLPHGAEGLLEWYLLSHTLPDAASETVKELRVIADTNRRAKILLERGTNRDSFAINNKCLCGSGLKYLQCHPPLWKLAHAIRYSNF